MKLKVCAVERALTEMLCWISVDYIKKINLFDDFNTLRLPPKIPQIKKYVENFIAATSQFQMLDNQDEDD